MNSLLAAAVPIFAPIVVPAAAAGFSVSIHAPSQLLSYPVAQTAISDSRNLLQQAMPSADVSINSQAKATVLIILPNVRQPMSRQHSTSPEAPLQRLPVPDRSYSWRSGSANGRTVLRLQARSAEGVACGLYGLLQGKLGFRFHHPRESIVPQHRNWPLPRQFTFSGRPRFEKTGFHLHTMHPVELTEQLLNSDYPKAFEDVAQYIDWLARNGQNTLQFVLLRGIDRDNWPRHAVRIVAYAHRRGVLCGVQISLSMLQQQAFQSITLLRLYPSYIRQADDTLAWLFQAPWDFVSLETTMGEHLPFLNKLVPDVQAHLEQQVAERYRALPLLDTHVIGGADAPRLPQRADSGILVHSVMCYSVSEAYAPVYGNHNQRFMLRVAREEQPRRETWYWPESSYWVGFDTPVPLLLPYLDARRQDIDTMSGLRLHGHLTFTSGWEWGYWLIDWSIARWSWEYRDAQAIRHSGPLTPLLELLPDPRLQPLWKEALWLQNDYLKKRDLMRFMAAATPFSELPSPFDKPFQPAPEFSYSRLLRSADQREVELRLGRPVRGLEEYAHRMAALVQKMEVLLAGVDVTPDPAGAMRLKLARELNRALAVSAFRARHRALTLKALSARVAERTEQGKRENSDRMLSEARLVRSQALDLVRQQESGYRYPLALLSGRRDSISAYTFGYLYPAGRLFFWEREEQQVQQGRFDPLFMNLWDVRQTLGLESLFFR